MSFFGSSPLEKKIEAATSENFIEAPLETYLEIAEDVSKSSDAGAQHLKYIRKRLGNKSPQVQYLATQLLDICVKNGRDAFHETLANREFLDFFAQFAQNNKVPHIRDAALSMIQSWSKAFPQTGLQSFGEIYNKMKNRGVPFPDTVAPVLTPPVNLTVIAQRKSSNRGQTNDRSPVPRSPMKNNSEEQKTPHPLSFDSPDYVKKIESESLQVIDYLKLFLDMINSASDLNDIKTNESILGLNFTILDCRNRVAHLLLELENELLMDLMLQMNELIRLTLEFYQAKVAGNNNIKTPIIEIPNALNTGKSSQSQQPGEQEEKHPEPDSLNSSIQNLNLNSANFIPTSQIQPQPQSQTQTQTKPLSTLDQFDPLASSP